MASLTSFWLNEAKAARQGTTLRTFGIVLVRDKYLLRLPQSSAVLLSGCAILDKSTSPSLGFFICKMDMLTMHTS